GLGAAPTPRPTPTGQPAPPARPGRITSWVYQLQDYPAGRLDAIARGPHQLAVIDLARDAHRDYFTAAEITALRRRGKKVLAYFEIGSVEDFRPEYRPLRAQAPDVLLNVWPDWPNERFVRYWDERWWQRAVRPRLDQALRAGFDGVYLDTPLAYEEIDLDLVPGWSRDRLARAMTALIVRISRYAKGRRPGFWVFPQNSPELRHHAGYTAAIDGIGMEELFYLATDSPCTADYCAENLAETRALRRAGKLVLAVDYATRPALVRAACGRYRREGFAGYAAVLDLDRVSAPCP
ncbi:MAG TPA: endo alpha-1,4 polygalactosaminidase, partial [Pilimelia sp.]|nr:endo alpha-1,4 polygalactosaminidase [Pilimelia sp.]